MSMAISDSCVLDIILFLIFFKRWNKHSDFTYFSVFLWNLLSNSILVSFSCTTLYWGACPDVNGEWSFFNINVTKIRTTSVAKKARMKPRLAEGINDYVWRCRPILLLRCEKQIYTLWWGHHRMFQWLKHTQVIWCCAMMQSFLSSKLQHT